MVKKEKTTNSRFTLAAVKTKSMNLLMRAKNYRDKRPHRSFKRTVRPSQKIGGSPVPTIWFLLKDSLSFMKREKWPLIRMALLYAIATYLVIGGLSQLDFIALREATMDVFGGQMAAFGTLFGLFGGVVGGSAAQAPSELQQLLGVLINFIFWLAVIWYVRMRLAGKKINVRDAFYNCCAPLISSSLVLLAVVVQLLPAIIALIGLTMLQAYGIAQSGAEAMVAVTAVILAFMLSAYWLSSSVLALVVVTLPQMYPWRALSAASELVIGQRWRLALHIAMLSLIILVVWAVTIALALLLDSWLRFDWLPIIPIIIQLLSGITAVAIAVYVYKLYRSLL